MPEEKITFINKKGKTKTIPCEKWDISEVVNVKETGNLSYVLLDETLLNNTKYYFGLRINEKEEPTNNYLFFEETKLDNDTFLSPIDEEDDMKGILLTAFTVNYLDKVYDEV